MKIKPQIRNAFIEVICLLYVLLFTYAAASKLLDFENFRIQLAQSPLLSAFAGIVSWSVILIELIIALILAFKRFRIFGLYASFTLMMMFSSYIYMILNYSSSIPCSCGGILEKMSWKQHLYFNVFFVFLTLVAILILSEKKEEHKLKRNILKDRTISCISLTACTVMALGIVIFLFLKSENIMKYNNSFIRRYSKGNDKVYEADLRFNSFYIAGVFNNKIYLGNTTAPLLVTVLDTMLVSAVQNKIIVKDTSLTKGVQLRVNFESFYLIDGNVGSILKGSVSNWNAELIWSGKIRFTQPQVVDSLNISIRTVDLKNNESEIAALNLGSSPHINLHADLLQKQVDGMFDVDGKLYYDPIGKRHAYVYYYRNEFIIADQSLKLLFRKNTIDTISPEKIKIAYLKDRKEKRLAVSPLIINKSASVYQNLLFINSPIKGRYEDHRIWDQASIIDVYNLNNKSYVSSFNVYHIKDQKLKSFYVKDDRFYGIIGNYLAVYRIGESFTNHYELKK